jgi:hypothetical protein
LLAASRCVFEVESVNVIPMCSPNLVCDA